MDPYTDGKLDEPVSIFKAACEQFRASLSEKQRQMFKEYSDAKSMLAAIQSQAEEHPTHRSVLTRCCKKIAALSTMLEPYFEVINLFVSSHPEFAGIAWGSLRLVFTMGTNHAQFLERVSELLETMSLKLPAYEEFHVLWRSRRPAAHPPTRLLTAMGYIYADLIQFCFDICQMLSRKRSRFLSLRGSFLSSLPSTLLNPFHVRYDTLLKRWDQHFKIVELEMAILWGMEQMEASDKIDVILKKFSQVGMFEDKTTKHEWRNIDEIKYRLRTWIDAPPWLGLLENAQNQRELDSTEWFIEHADVAQWVSQHSQEDAPSFQALSVQGKPGFGKTTLCTTLIEHLRKHVAISSKHAASQKHKSALTFFYFDKQRPDSVKSSALWRVVVMQLLNLMPAFDPDIIDMFLLFRENQSASQSVASDNEVFSILCLLIQRLDRLILVIDGIDECQDQMHFWNRLQIVCDGPASTSVALFSRPTVILPPRLMENSIVLALDNTLNLDDIRTFLRPRITNMVTSGFMGQYDTHHDWENTIDQIGRRANGMFLWATMFVEYLQSPHISIRGRHEAIENLNRLEGLDLLYGAILRTLTQRPGSARTNTLRAFELVLYSVRPLHVSELQYAIATPMNRALEPEDLIPDFSRNLGHLSGALMELDKNGFVRFVHLSIIEYLMDARERATRQDVSTEVVMDMAASHASLACRCLSYLYHSVKAEPLVGSSRAIPDSGLLVKKYPLLDYATEFWSFHVLECMEALDSSPTNQPVELVVELASKFLSSPRSVLAWIEASWMFKRPPQIRHGPNDLFLKGKPRMPPHLDTRLRSAWEAACLTLMELSQDLAALNKSWAHVLKEEPNEIWEPSISAFNQSPFWQRISGAHIAAQFEAPIDPDYHSICAKTKLSPDGRYLGLIRLYISRQDNTRLTLSFERWSIKPNVKLHEVNLNIPRSCLKPFLCGIRAPREDAIEREFQCPVSITADLDRVAAPGCVIHIAASEKEQEEDSLDDRTQFIDFTGNSWRNGPFRFGIEDFQLSYDLQLSDSGRYLMTVHKSNGIVDVDRITGCHLRLLTVYEDTRTGTSTRPSYRHVASLAFKPDYLPTEEWLNDGDLQGDWCALLHPQYPVVAIKFQRITVLGGGRVIKKGRDFSGDGTGSALWDFADPTSDCLRFTPHRPKRLVFDHNSEYFCGIPVRPNPAQQPPPPPKTLTPFPTPHASNHPTAPHNHHHHHSLNLTTPLPLRTTQQQPPATQTIGQLTSSIDPSTGLRTLSRLENSGNSSGSVVLATLREDGLLRAETLTRLPGEIVGDYKAAVVHVDVDEEEKRNGEGEGVRVVFLDREDRPFRRHRIPGFGEEGGRNGDGDHMGKRWRLPMVLERKRETIPVDVGEGRLGHGGYDMAGGIGWRGGMQGFKRLGEFGDCEEGREGKRRVVCGFGGVGG